MLTQWPGLFGLRVAGTVWSHSDRGNMLAVHFAIKSRGFVPKTC